MRSIIFLFSFSMSLVAGAQEVFIDKGVIEFEKTVNVHKRFEEDMEEEGSSFYETLKKQTPQLKLTYFNLYFNNAKSLYEPGREAQTLQKVPEWLAGPAEENRVYTDLDGQVFSSQKAVFETVFNIQDSIKKFDWKITDDSRTIAGFRCRKATTILMDSVFVFAFYTDQIIPALGPEGFNGLPGMILGIAIPRMHATWFATKVQVEEPATNVIAPPKKGKKSTVEALQSALQNSLKRWGKYGERYIWSIMI